jgi:uncharacterized membrane protein YuzA (DUF378 family)
MYKIKSIMASDKLKKALVTIVLIIASIGAINWILNAHNYNLVDKFIPAKGQRAVYYTIGAAGVASLVMALMYAFKKEGFEY